MRETARRLSFALAALLLAAPAGAADLPPPPLPEPLPPTSGWTFRFVPYGWLTSLDGTQTVRGRSVKVNASFTDIVEDSDTLVALMGDFEARYGRLGLYTDVVWSNVSFSGNTVKTRSPAPGITGTVGTAVGLDLETAIVEAGAIYEAARIGPLAFDLVAGARYWYMKTDLSLDVAGTLEVGDLEVAGARAIARSGSIDWVDPFVGGRLRYALVPGHELFLRGDVGGFGAGSQFSWQAVGGYTWDFGVWNNITFSGVIGYRALYVDYERGSGRTRFEYDMLEHGPIVGLSMRF
jgi:hypothetical protein